MKQRNNKMNMGLVFFVVALFIASAGATSVGHTIKTEKNETDENNDIKTSSLIEPIDCGYLEVDGKPGDYPDVEYDATAYNNYDIDLNAEEAEVTLTVSYYLNPAGDADRVYTDFWCNGQHASFDTTDKDKTWEGELEITLDLQHDSTYEFEISVLWTDWWDTREVGDDQGDGGPRTATGEITTKRYVEPGEPMGCAIIVEAGFGDGLQSSFHRSAKYAKETFEHLGYEEGTNLKCFNRPTKSELKNFIKDDLPNWLGSDGQDNVFFYIVDHGVGKATEDIIDFIPSNEGKVVLNNNKELLSSSEIGNWFHSIVDKYAFGIFVIEACFGGEWISNEGGIFGLSKCTDHIVITSTDDDHVSYGWTDGQAVFSKPFFEALWNGKTSYGAAWEAADAEVYSTMKDLCLNIRIQNLVKTVNNNYSGFISNSLFKLLSLFEQDIFYKLFTAAIPTEEIMPLYRDVDDMMKMWKEYRNYLMQSPWLSDDGDRKDAVGTKGKNVVDKCSKEWNEDGKLALGVYPSKPWR